MKPEVITTSELAGMLGVTRQTVFNWIKNGHLKANKVGNSYAIPRASIPELATRTASAKKRIIETAVDNTISQYGEVLKRLGSE